MGLLKSIGMKIKTAEKKIKKAEKEAKPITSAAMRTFDYLIPPPKKKGKKVKLCPCKKQR